MALISKLICINIVILPFPFPDSNKRSVFLKPFSTLAIPNHINSRSETKQTSSTVAQMFKLLKATFGFLSDSDENSLTNSSASNSNGIEVRVGRLPHARFFHIPRSALKACPVLRTRLVHGCSIMNADAVAFEVILEYLSNSSLLGQLRLNARNPSTQLTSGCDRMLKLAKAWHLADMLDDIRLQNKLVDAYRVLYLELLSTHTRIPLDYEAFVYLESHLGTHTKIEKFIIDFFAGLARYTGDFSAEELLPCRHDVAQALKVRHAQLVVRGKSDDMIATGNTFFNVTKSDATTHTSLQVIKPIRAPSSTDVNSLPLQCGSSTPSLSSSVSTPISPRAATSSISPTCRRRHQVRLSLPRITSINGQPKVLVSRTLVPVLKSTFGVAVRPIRARSVSPRTPFPSRASFMAHKLIFRRQRTDVISDDESSDEDTVYDLVSPDLRLLYDFSRALKSSVTTDIQTA